MKKVIIGSFLFFVIIAVLSFFTKTTQQEFQEKALQEWRNYNDEMANNPVMEDVIEVQNEFMTSALRQLVVTEDYGIFTMFTLHLADGDYQYLGLFHQIIPLQKANPINQFYQNDEK
jgi:hypothetical protein